MKATYVVHCLDEAIVNGGFVKMVKKHFWPQYTAKKFFWFNFLIHGTNITTIILYEILDGGWVILPLSMCWLFVTNGFWHILEALLFREYSPGLATSLLYWIIMYNIARYGLLSGSISLQAFITSAIIGSTITTLMIGSLFIMRKRQ